MKKQALRDKRRAARMKQLQEEFIIGLFIILIIIAMGATMMYVAYDRQQKYPQYGTGIFPRSPDKREEKYIYIGR
jgi:hypothetical protein